MAEVCDKMVRSWSPEDGRATLWSPLINFISSPIGAAIILLLLIAAATKRRWLHAVNAFITLAVILLTSLSWLGELGSSGVIQAAIREGCWASPWLLLAGMGLALVWSLVKFLPKTAKDKRTQ
jgi:hypothetical protein